MGRKIVEKHEQGDFGCEWVDEIPPLGEDRKTIFALETPMAKLVTQIEEAVAQARNDMFGLMAIILSSLAAKYGDEVWDVASQTMYDIGYQRGPEFAQTMKIDPRDARSVGRIFDLEESGVGIKGEWVETGKKRAVKRDFYCPFAGVAALCPEVCTRLFDAVERGTMDAIGARVKDFHFAKLLPKGDPYCEVVLELED